MKKIDKKRIVILIILIIMLIIQIKAFNDSRANKLTDITAKIIDMSGLLNDENYMLQAVNEEESGTVITLPSVINEKKVEKYIVEVKQIQDTDEKTEEEIEEATEQDSEIVVEEVSTQVTSTDSTEENETIEEVVEETKNVEENIQTKCPGEKLYLTEQELEKGENELKVVYETKEKNEQILYNKVLEKETEEHKITMVGYMPSDAQINIEKVSEEVVTPKLEQHMNENTTLRVAYDITIMVQDQEFEPKQFDENVEETISGITTVEDENYKVVHIDDENNTEELQDIEIQEDRVIFNAVEFSTYAVLSETATTAEIAVDDVTTVTSEFNPQNTWDGSTIATGFSWGEGTIDKPYLIADGSELAYLAKQVNSGTTYEGNYFQLASDIDLGNNEWTPIGTTENSFRGNLDGAGHTIAYAEITVSNLPDQTYESYGIFGSIGGGDTRSIIRNVE